MDDRALVRATRRGDRDAAAELFRRHWQAAWRAAYGVTGRRAMADDIAADAFERAFAALGRFDDRRPFRPWLHRIVVNRALDLLRSERRLVGGDLPFEAAEVRDDGDRGLLEAIAELPLQRRVVVILRYGIGMGAEEIAGVLDLPVGTVHSRLARALEQLREVRGVERA
jgi:RNA polymerase sigma-70 factor (ECF subfamily)